MTCFSLSAAAKRSQFFALLFAAALVASACSGSSDVEVDDASATTETSDETEETTSEDTDDGDDVSVEAESDAMGEDEAAVDNPVETTTPAEDDAADGSTANAELGSAELAAALEAGTADRFSLPFMYLTVDQDCSGCAETMSLYYVPSEEKASILTLAGAYIDGVAQSDFSAVDPSLQAGDPRRIAEQLANTDAQFSIDTVSGAVTSWTLDGNTVTLRCLQVDTRPLDMRTEVCENSIIG